MLYARVILCNLVLVLLCAMTNAQEVERDTVYTGTQGINDILPDLEFEMYNYPEKKAKLSDFGNKSLIILDFWGVWCHSCIKLFPKLDSLQDEFSENLQIILVNDFTITHENLNRIKNRFENSPTSKIAGIKLPVAYGNINSRKLLKPFNVFPHYIWLTSERKIIAITSSEHVTEKNIRSYLTQKTIDVPEKTWRERNYLSRPPASE